MTHDFLTIHQLIALPYHNRNRDDRHAPKTLVEGGVTRGVLSSQSQKRAARIRYEELAAATGSVRSRHLAGRIADRAEQIAGDAPFDRAAADATARTLIAKLTKNTASAETAQAAKDKAARAAHERKAPKDGDVDAYMAEFDRAAEDKRIAAEVKAGDRDSDTAIWISDEEVEIAAAAIARGDRPETEDVFAGATGSLAIAAFGRMFANQPDVATEAAVAVSPAVTTHPISIGFDTFTAIDDLASRGAAHWSQASHTTGVYYRTQTIDRKQLRRSWTGADGDRTREQLEQFVRALIETVPQGRKNGSAAETRPAVILAEQQAYRFGYQFETPVAALPTGGYLEPSVNALFEQATQARDYDPDAIGAAFISGVQAGLAPDLPGAGKGGIRHLTEFIVDWALA
ncbi:type I-E CRISPR-associated protein Cas7/Cse4/CasC [Agromyces humi]|uniref:type I-E CRISPR-associated protein Cas7/Cse4/CasC n=1 Tax=Agromyces humi TaxID=1766800 RepID=UPI0013567A02|nr:type I-E CRISPR-associated protein Cas7/Cse4/CasC [Agromyces humi]